MLCIALFRQLHCYAFIYFLYLILLRFFCRRLDRCLQRVVQACHGLQGFDVRCSCDKRERLVGRKLANPDFAKKPFPNLRALSNSSYHLPQYHHVPPHPSHTVISFKAALSRNRNVQASNHTAPSSTRNPLT
ncbi:PREDICTED: uncharacterized protein LOC107354516 [Acropora digitifera]|uniref:uncharacterized protein LOC107354516 n=1 Tax=Acropora digitifera TaxID=70779 RepID=UPI00077AAC5C|nr:PREDICTED: uncharacterized protein LOC107354516 [Acropora digitifera]